MRVLVTGGAGFIGSNFVNRTLLTKPEKQITVLDSLTYAGDKDNILQAQDRMAFVNGSILDRILVDELVANADLVVHFAAETHNDNSLVNPQPFLETNIMGTFEMIEACVRHDVRYHHISTDEVFGELTLESEERFSTKTPYSPSSPYSASKASSDMLVRAWVRSFGLRATITNCSNNYGVNQHREKFIPRSILLAASGIKPKIYGNGGNIRDWIHVDDHNDGVWSAVEMGRIGETYLLGADGQRSNLQVVHAILRELDLPEDFVEFVTDRPGHDLRYSIDASGTVSELGWEPRYKSFEDGLKPVVSHYAELARSGKINVSKISGSGASVGH